MNRKIAYAFAAIFCFCVFASSALRAEDIAAPLTDAQQEAAMDAWRNKPCIEAEKNADEGSDADKVSAAVMTLRHCLQNRPKTLGWLQQAADHNYPDGIFWLGLRYEYGSDVPQDQKRPSRW